MVTGGLTRWLMVVSMPLATPRPNAIWSLRSRIQKSDIRNQTPRSTRHPGDMQLLSLEPTHRLTSDFWLLTSLTDSRREPDDRTQQTAQAGEQRRQAEQNQ